MLTITVTEEIMGKANAATLVRKHPHYGEWHGRMMDRSAVQAIMRHKVISSQ